MRRGFVVGAVVGAVVSLAIGIFVAVLPSTPTWALWRIKQAIDANDADELSRMVDLVSVTQRAISELDGKNGAMDLGQLASVYLSGGKILTVFNDPEKPLEITGGDVLTAWWGMRREGDLAYFTVPAGDRTVDLILGYQPEKGGWRIVGVTPMSALLTIKPRPTRQPMIPRASPVAYRDAPSGGAAAVDGSGAGG